MSTRRRLLGALVVGSLLAGTAVGPAGAVVAPQMSVSVGSDYVYVWNAAPSTTYKLTLLDGTEVLGVASAKADGYGDADFSLGTDVLPAMKLRLTATGYTRTVTVPNLGVRADRATDVVAGVGPAGKSLFIDVQRFKPGTWTWTTPLDRMITVAANGTFSTDFTAAGGFAGGDSVYLTYRNPTTGDDFAVDISVDYMAITRGSSRVAGEQDGPATIELRTPGGVVRGRAHLSSLWGESAFATSAGAYVYPRTGEKVVGDFATDATMTIPAITITADAATDVVTLTCPGMAAQGAEIQAHKADWSVDTYREGATNASGIRTWDVTADIDLRSGDALWGKCKYDSGDEIARPGFVP